MTTTKPPVTNKGAAVPEDWATQQYEASEDTQALKHLGIKYSTSKMEIFRVSPPGKVNLENIFRGRKAFLICGGPSLAQMDLAPLRQRGMLTMGINNSWIAYRPNLWCGVDPPWKFSDICWCDPAVMKFTSICNYNTPMHTRDGRGEFHISHGKPCDLPNVFYFRRRSLFDHRTFLTWPSASWGNNKMAIGTEGYNGCRSVMLVALRLLHYLGVRYVFIVGADFGMSDHKQNKKGLPDEDDGHQNYAWKQFRQPSSVASNNRTYNALNRRFELLVPEFQKAKFFVWNCTPGGNLNTLPRMRYEEAVKIAKRGFVETPPGEGWYNRKVVGGKIVKVIK